MQESNKELHVVQDLNYTGRSFHFVQQSLLLNCNLFLLTRAVPLEVLAHAPLNFTKLC